MKKLRHILVTMLYSLTPLIAYAAVEPPVQLIAQTSPGMWENLARTPFILALCLIVWMFLQDRQKRDDVVQQLAASCHEQTASREDKYEAVMRDNSAALREQAVSSQHMADAVQDLSRTVEKIEGIVTRAGSQSDRAGRSATG